MYELSICEASEVGAGMLSGQCTFELGLNYLITAGAIGFAIGTGGLGAAAGIAGAAYSWSGWYRDCGPSANYGR